MKYQVEFSKLALKQLKKLDKSVSALIMGWIKKNLVDCENPRAHGKGLTANHSKEWHYRVGDYRIIAEIKQDKIVILILSIGHRSEIYK